MRRDTGFFIHILYFSAVYFMTIIRPWAFRKLLNLLEGIDRELIDVFFRCLPRGTDGSHEKPQDSLVPAERRMRQRNYHYSNLLVVISTTFTVTITGLVSFLTHSPVRNQERSVRNNFNIFTTFYGLLFISRYVLRIRIANLKIN